MSTFYNRSFGGAATENARVHGICDAVKMQGWKMQERAEW